MLYASAGADFEYARQSLAALVAKAWFLATEARLQREFASDMVGSGERLIALANDRKRVGVGSDLDVVLARTNVQTFRDSARQLDLAYEQSLRALELLLGRYPSAKIEAAPQLTAMPDPVPAGLPSELLERRPDVIAAERRVAAAFNRVEEAKAATLPSISLTAGLNYISSDILVLKNRDNPAWSIGAKLLAPLYRGGALEAQVEIRTAEQKEVLAAYAQTGLKAFSELENALSSEFAMREREAILGEGVQHNQSAGLGAGARFPFGHPTAARPLFRAHGAAAGAERATRAAGKPASRLGRRLSVRQRNSLWPTRMRNADLRGRSSRIGSFPPRRTKYKLCLKRARLTPGAVHPTRRAGCRATKASRIQESEK